MTYLDRAIKDGYAIITGPENKQKIIYVTSDNHTENYNDPEEKVRAEFWAELIYEYDYPAHRIKVEVTIPDRVPTDRADIVIFSDDECKKPYAVVECKRDGVTDAEFLQAIEQGVGNATWVKLRASYVVIIAGATRRVLDFSDDSTGILERENNNQAGVNTDTLKRVKIPLPPKEIQDQIAAELMQRRSQANVLRRQAIKEWADAKAQFEKELLGE